MRISEHISYKIECPFCTYRSESNDKIEAVAQAMHHGKQHVNNYLYTDDGYIPIAYKPMDTTENTNATHQ